MDSNLEFNYSIVYYMNRKSCESLAKKSELALDIIVAHGKYLKACENARIELNNEIYSILKKHNVEMPTDGD